MLHVRGLGLAYMYMYTVYMYMYNEQYAFIDMYMHMYSTWSHCCVRAMVCIVEFCVQRLITMSLFKLSLLFFQASQYETDHMYTTFKLAVHVQMYFMYVSHYLIAYMYMYAVHVGVKYMLAALNHHSYCHVYSLQ